MTTPSLPSRFMPAVTGYGLSDPGGVMRTEVAGGSARTALDWDSGPQNFTITLFLELDEYAVWTAFYHHIIKKGARSFLMPLDSGFGVSPHLVTMLPGSYSPTRSAGNLWVVGFAVEAENQAYELSSQEAAGLIDMYNTYGAGLASLLERLARFATVDSNIL
jgi:hypothetical protein